ncbi:hypothetical protein NXS19_011305 [Fusarium pseudograminearum]|nr:hypothetical protein NXS19_011305 [Fusarium pseudograminearum]
MQDSEHSFLPDVDSLGLYGQQALREPNVVGNGTSLAAVAAAAWRVSTAVQRGIDVIAWIHAHAALHITNRVVIHPFLTVGASREALTNRTRLRSSCCASARARWVTK